MKKKIYLSTWCIIMTAIGLTVLFVALYCAKDAFAKYIVIGALVILCMTALLYMPLSISVKDGCLNINRPLKIKSIPMSQIISIKLCPPTMAEKRICGSGGWFGYYGWFNEPSIGKYFCLLWQKPPIAFLSHLKMVRSIFLVAKILMKWLLMCKMP